ncbi:UPF0449 protein C19orf25 homolog isoform X1 [Podarcis lilfordi]|uniref:UPF0449 protein C19orf25 homolog isoform X1 n=1 Tax=Podarcis lilfordi TaxID=74358 RepID=A0AA35PW76_9SAUR|nr:UPF0449 protein C19orf25 homolog isoform X1 [Podarcis lilfordi]
MTTPLPRYDFSLWYCLDDDAVATAICQLLAEHGFRGYVEHQDHVAGRQELSAVGEVIQASRVAILLLTPRSVADPWCRRVAEWNLDHAVHREGAKVIPVYVGVSREETSPALRHLNGLEYGERFFKQRLLSSLRKAGPHGQTPRPSGVSGTKKRAGF